MDDRASESGMNFVVDNRKIIIAFALLIALCGCFFVIGFVEGKRQGAQVGSRISGDQRDLRAASGEQGKKAPDEKSTKAQLDWYKSINDKGAAGSKPEEKKTSASTKAAETPKQPQASSARPAAAAQSATPPAKTIYSVQCGVFKDRGKAEAAANTLKSKGYQSYIESSTAGIYALRVGRYESRAEAVAMRNRLKQDGFDAFLKAN